MKDIKVTATLKVIVTGDFYDFEASEETLRSCVEQDLEDVGFDVDVELLKEQPDIVRCKDCIYHHYDNNRIPYCELADYGYGWHNDDFCSRGKRR